MARRDSDEEPRVLTPAQKILQEKMRDRRRRSKYGNVRVLWNGHWFDSIHERDWAKKLELLKKAKGRDRVKQIEYQVPFTLSVNDKKICDYVADFVVRYEDGRCEVMDAKGVETDVFKLKRKMMRAILDIEIIVLK